ncbi:MAG: FKBP-type peptidyl-prolyl cis-trans isomerase [Clostridia bacterium]|nr:FKBP-type peptidyl-prolyl cis-trans isomerase [[Bacteroides] pectinophilus]MDD5873821.1 FKBP-type peptidyl-prolyl cis-trans isomerase [Clostridia bacterium]
MRKSYLAAALMLTMALTFTACGKSGDNGSEAGTKGSTSNVNYSEQLQKDSETYKQYVDLGEYKGVEVEVDRSSLDVTQDQVTAYIDNIRSSKGEDTEVTTGTTKLGDKIKLDYSGTLNGVAFSGGTATDVEYTIGSGRFIKDLDNGLAGLEVGKEYDIPCHFDDSYSNSDLAGKDVNFRVKVNAIVTTTLPEYNDDFVKTIVATGSYDTQAQTTDEFTKYVEQTLKDSAQQSFDSNKYSAIWDKIDETTNVSGYPEDELADLKQTINDNVKSEYSYYGTYYSGIDSFESYLKNVYGFADEAAFNEYADQYARNYLKEKMILTLIGEKEGITVSDDEINEYGELIASQNNYDSYQSMLDSLGQKSDDVKLEVGYSVLADKVSDILLNNAVEK